MTLPMFPHLSQMLAGGEEIAVVLPGLQRKALEAAGGRRSLLLQLDTRTGLLHATSGLGFEMLPAATWPVASPEMRAAEEAIDTRSPVFDGNLDREAPELAALLNTPAVLAVPLLKGEEPLGVLLLGLDGGSAPADLEGVALVGSTIALALEIARLRRDAARQRQIRALLDGFSRIATSTLNLHTAIEAFCREARGLFDARRASLWMHERRARKFVLAASSDPEISPENADAPADSAGAPSARALRRVRAEMSGRPDARAVSRSGCDVTVPLRGRRRALGVLVLEGVQAEACSELDLLDDADELGRQLSAGIENIQLLEEVIRSRREFETTFRAVPDLVAVCDTTFRIVQVNQTFLERVGAPRDHVIGRGLADFLGVEATAWIRSLDAWGKGGPSEAFKREFDDPVLGASYALTVTTLIGPEGDPIGIVIVGRDLTAVSRLEAEQAKLRDRLTESEKMAVIGQFVAGIAHELNNPLQSVLGNVELLQNRPGVPSSLREDLETVFKEANRAAGVVRDLLVFAGRRRMKGRKVDVNAVLSGAIRRHRTSAVAAGAPEVISSFDASLPRIDGDALRLRQAFGNVIANAVQAAGPGGNVEVSTRHWPARNLIVVEVRDNGSGIPEAALPRIFEPFFSTRQAGSGTGLGLTIAASVVRDHSGHIHAANHQSGGAVFTIELPVRMAR